MLLVEEAEEEDVVMMLRLPGWNTARTKGRILRTAGTLRAILTITGVLATPQAVRAEQIVSTDAAPACSAEADKAGMRMLGTLVETVPPCRHQSPEVTDRAGQPVGLELWRGKVVLVNLWATWCQPCLKEMPSLMTLQRTLGGDRFQVVAISQDLGGARQVDPYLARNSLTGLDILLDPKGNAGRAFHAPGLPVSILLDPQGRQIARLTGEADWTNPAITARLKALIAATGPQ
ncbi:hypothetical protein GCM10027256_28720 [Novispirillum itersonii subsp. nipponicum]|uniref:Thiol-disulfide isomerase/thioredoxin n=2 Tax=Novispirillum itersonii TaxID=189 RepID=A0A7X0DM82_NOVIT|nr:thiol-disulfide isomerase/thioredoxin [Novispirillum itersonii]